MRSSRSRDFGRQIVLSLQRLDRVREVDPASDAMTLEAGVTLARAQEIAESVDRYFPLSLASEGSCTIGGNLATNAGGVHVLAYGAARDLYHGRALAIVKPSDATKVANVLALCNAQGVAVVPQGGNTGLVGGQTPDESGRQIVLSLQKLDRILKLLKPHSFVENAHRFRLDRL